MKQLSLIKDKIDGSPFAVLLINKNNVTAYGAPGQGDAWAQWINARNTTVADIDELLDVRLMAQKPVPISSINESYVSTFLNQETTDLLMGEINKKSLLQIVNTKSEPEPEFIDDEDIDLPDFTPIMDWPLSDVSLSAIDVAYKAYLTDYKAKAFHADRQRRALELEVKWARAIWDNDRQGWRCPPNTVNGGQFTNRMGLGCSTGMVRRLGQTLMSIEDRNKLQMQLPGLEDPRGFLYRAGELIDQRAETRVRKFAEGKERRAARRVRSMIAKQGKEAQEQAEKEQRKLAKEGRRFAKRGNRFREIYDAYTPDATVPARLRAATAVKLRNLAQTAEQNALVNLNRSERRRYRAMRNVSEEKLSPRTLKRLRDFGGKIPGSKLGGYVIADPAGDGETDTFDHDGKPHVWRAFSSMDEMHANPWFGREFLTDDSGNQVNNVHKDHKWVTVEEILAMASLNRATKPKHDWIEMRRGRGFKDSNGQNGAALIRFADADEFRKLEKQNGHHGVRTKLKDDGKGIEYTDGKGRGKTKPAQGGPIGDADFTPDELPPSVRKRVAAAWTRSRQNLGEWIRNLDPLLEDDSKSRRQKRRQQRSKQKTVSAARATNILTEMLGNEPDDVGIDRFLHRGMGATSNYKESGFDFDFLDEVFTNDPSAPARRYGWNETVGTPTQEFEYLKDLVDRIVSEHGAEIMTSSADSANDLATLLQVIRNSSRNNDGTKLQSPMSYHNARVVELFDGEESRKVIMLDTITMLPWYGLEDGDVEFQDGTSGLVSITSKSSEINAPQNVVELAEAGKLSLRELVSMARDANTAGNTGYIRGGQALGYSLPDGEWTVVPWNSTREIAFNRAGAPLLIAADSYYGGYGFQEGTSSTHIPGSRASTVDIRTGGLISGRMGKETILTPEGEDTWENSSIDPWTGLPLDPNMQAMFTTGPRLTGGGRRKTRRTRTGASPQKSGIVQRFLTGEGRQMARDRREAKRVIKGKLPRDTRPIRQRIQAAALEKGRRVTGEARPEWLQAPDVDRSVLERESLIATGQLPDAPANANRVKLPYIYDFPTPKEFPQGADWINSGDNRQRMDELNDSLYDLGQSFYPPVKQEDIDRAPELAELVDEWQKDLNDPSQQSLPDESSNWGHAAWVPDGPVTYVFDARDETMPPIAIVHTDSGTTHLIGKDGKHLVSLVARRAANGEAVWVPVGSRATHIKLNGDNEQQSGFIQTLLGRFRRRDARQREETKPGIAGLRQRRRALTLREQPNGGEWGIQQFKDHAESLGVDNANIVGPYSFPTQARVGVLLDEMGPYDSRPIFDSAERIANRLEAQLKRQLGLAPSDELTTAAVRDKIEDLKAAGRSREAGIMTNDLHDLAVLDDILQSGDASLVDNLKPGRRHQIIEEYPTFTLTEQQKKRRRPFSAADIVTPADASISQAGRLRPRVRTFTSGKPILDEPSPNASSQIPPRVQTGPALIPGVGDVTGTIVFQNGKYFDTTTGKYLEDLSGLDAASPDIVFTPTNMDDALTNGIDFIGDGWPLIRLDAGPGMPTRNAALIAPGEPNPTMPKTGSRRNAINRITSIPESFTEAFHLIRNRWRVLAAGDSRQVGLRWGLSVHSTSERLDTTGNPMLSVADGLESELGLSSIFAPVNNPRSSGSGASIATLISALRGQSRKSTNPLFAEFLDESVLSESELRAFPTTTDRSGFAGGTRSVFAVLDALGVRTNLPFETIYVPAGGSADQITQLPGGWDIFDDTSAKTLAMRHLNEALQLDYVVERMRQTLSNGLQANWDGMYGTRVGGSYDLTPAMLENLERQREMAWTRATQSLVTAIKEAETARNDALRNWRESFSAGFDANEDETWDITEFISHGVNAEQLQALLTKHVLTNPVVMDSFAYSSIRRMEEDAKATNQRMERLALLKAQAAAVGLRNKATYTPDDIDPITLTPILDPHGDGAVQAAPDRTVPEILQTIDEHAASGFSVEPTIDPATGTSASNPILDEQIEALALVDFTYQKGLAAWSSVTSGQLSDEYGYTGTPEADSQYGHLELDSLPPEATAAYGSSWPDYWPITEASGFNGHPILLSATEFRELATIEDANGNRQALPIARGTESPARNGLSARMLARLRRAVYGRSGEQHGPGEYWTGKPSSWDKFRSEGTIGLILRGRHRVGSVEILITEDGTTGGNRDKGILAGHAYNALFAVANALGAPGFRGGVNWSHGGEYRPNLPEAVIDPVTGMYNPADLDALQRAVDELLSPGDASRGLQGAKDAGKMTVENYSERTGWFVDSVLPDFVGQNGPRVQAAIEERQRLNAFLAQNLSWMIQLAQLRRDESDPVNGKANKQWNRRLAAAQHELVMMHPNSRAVIAGYDVMVRDSQNDVDETSSYNLQWTRFGDYDMWEGDGSITRHRPSIVMVNNRSKTPMLRQAILNSGWGGARYSTRGMKAPSDPSLWFKQVGLEALDFIGSITPPGPNATQTEILRWQYIQEQANDWGIDLS